MLQKVPLPIVTTHNGTSLNLEQAYDPKQKDEFVLCVLPSHPMYKPENNDYFANSQTTLQFTSPLHFFHSDEPDSHAVVKDPRQANHTIYMERRYAENFAQVRQLIPYNMIVLVHKDGSHSIQPYQRAKGTGDKRLLGNYSIGYGGHVNMPSEKDVELLKRDPKDMSLLNRIALLNLVRELNEEVSFKDITEKESMTNYQDHYSDITMPYEGDIDERGWQLRYGVIYDPKPLENFQGQTFAKMCKKLRKEWSQLNRAHSGIAHSIIIRPFTNFMDNDSSVNEVHLCIGGITFVMTDVESHAQYLENKDKRMVALENELVLDTPVDFDELTRTTYDNFEGWSVTYLKLLSEMF